MGPVIPILRIFDIAKARDFYLGFLGFAWDWEHRFAPGMPLYAQVSRAGVALHLSEHHGDGTPGSGVLVTMRGLDDFHAEIAAKGYAHYRPAIEDAPWGARTMAVLDPFGNRLTFSESTDA